MKLGLGDDELFDVKYCQRVGCELPESSGAVLQIFFTRRRPCLGMFIKIDHHAYEVMLGAEDP